MRYLVVGCGSIGKRHIDNLLRLETGEVLATDISPGRRREVESRFGIEAFDDLDLALARQPDAAVIATPPHSHVELALRAAQQGCHLFIEKPLADRMGGVEELERIVGVGGLVTLVGCNLRFHPGLMEVKRLLDEGAIGRTLSASAHFGQYLPTWHPSEDYRGTYSAHREEGGGIILDAVHEIDYLRWLIGEVSEVICFAEKLSDLEIDSEDVAALLLRFDGGAIGEVHVDYVQRVYSRTCRVIGVEGTIEWDYVAGTTRVYTEARGRWEVSQAPGDWEPNRMYVEEFRHFIRCLRGEDQPICDVSEGRRVLQTALAGRVSAATGKAMRPDAIGVAAP